MENYQNWLQERKRITINLLAEREVIPGAARSYIHKAYGMLLSGKPADEVVRYLPLERMENLEKQKDFDTDEYKLYWSIPVLIKLYAQFREKLSIRVISALEQTLWQFMRCYDYNLFCAGNPANRLYISENHEMLQKSSMYLCGCLLESHDKYKNFKSADGHTPEEIHIQAKEALENILENNLKNGLWLEGSGNYTGVTLEGVYNILELSKEKRLRELAKKYLDAVWLDYGVKATGGFRGGAKARVYMDQRLEKNSTDWVVRLANRYFDFFEDRESCYLDHVLSGAYIPPIEAYMLAISEQKETVCINRARGAGFHLFEHNEENARRDNHIYKTLPRNEIDELCSIKSGMTHIYYMDNTIPVMQYTYVNKSFSLGSFYHPFLLPVTLVSWQNRWEGAVLSGGEHGGKVLVSYESEERVIYDGFLTMQNGPVLIYYPYEPKIYFNCEKLQLPICLLTDPEPEEVLLEHDQLYFKLCNAYICIRALKGRIFLKNGRYLIEQTTPVVMRMAETDDYKNLITFREVMMNNEAKYDGDKITYCDHEWGKMEFWPRDLSIYNRLINETPYDYRYPWTFQSKYVEARCGCGEFIIKEVI